MNKKISIPCGEIGSSSYPRFNRMAATFQFLVVRLGGYYSRKAGSHKLISIPCGEIGRIVTGIVIRPGNIFQFLVVRLGELAISTK